MRYSKRINKTGIQMQHTKLTYQNEAGQTLVGSWCFDAISNRMPEYTIGGLRS